ncbi:MAG TPA: efflux RND transporter permease subunit [Chloroflexota bacterium]|nr:efflux RND transporter permease subunit [Chloroflexota bacterium]
MGLTRVSILRPLFISMVMLGLVVIGLVSYTRLGVDLLPAINFPVVTVVVPYPGAGPESIEQLVVKPIEDQLAGESNLDYMVSQSTEGAATITLIFKETANVDAVAIDVERKVNGIRAQLPQDIQAPSIIRADVNAQPILNLSIAGQRSQQELFKIADEKVAPRLSTVPGVASATISGGQQSQVVVDVDLDKLRAYGLSILQFNQALQNENQNVPAGTLTERGRDYSVRLNALFTSPEKIRDAVVATTASGPVYVRDVATVSMGYQKLTRMQRTDGKDAIGILITKQSDSNTLQVSDGVRKELATLQKELPADVKIDVVSDQAIFTRSSLDDVRYNLVEAVLLTGLVLLVFLHTFRSTFIILLAIPTSLISTFIVMFFLGFTLNMMSLMALALTVGILVDDSIVVLENIFRHLELGENRFVAALKGRSEIGLAAITITLVDVVVYAPIAFMSGIVGQYFRQFGLVIATATLFSLFVSFTLTPMLASRWLSLPDPRSKSPLAIFGRVWERGWVRLSGYYSALLRASLRFRWITVAVAILSLVFGIGLIAARLVGFEFMPQTDQSELVATLEMPPGTTLAVTSEAARKVEDRFLQWPETKSVFSTIGTGGGNGLVQGSQARFARITIELKKPWERTKSQNELANEARSLGDGIPGLKLRMSQASFAGPGGPPVNIIVSGDDDAVLSDLAAKVEDIVRRTPGTIDVTNSAAVGSPEMTLTLDREKAADLGLTAGQVASALRTGISGTVATQYQPVGQKAIDVRVMASDADLASVDQLNDIPLTTSKGTIVKLGQVAQIKQTVGPSQIDRRDRQRQIAINSELTTRPLGEVSRDIQAELDKLAVPPGFSVKFGGQTQAQNETFGQMFQALGLSVLLMYMLMVALYESLLYPFIIMLSLPLAIAGAIFGLFITGNTLNMMSMIGMIMLMGLVGKNAILLVDYTNTLRKQGMERNEALLHAGPTRLRPILMTTCAMVISMAPIAAKLGEGSEFRAPMAVVVMGGLISSTMLTLVVIPAVYTIFDDVQGLFGRAFGFRRRRSAVPAASAAEEIAAYERAQAERELIYR